MFSQKIKNILAQLYFPLLGTIFGVLYAIADESLIQKLIKRPPPKILIIASDFIDLILPVVFGLILGFLINILRKRTRLNKQLSIQNAQFQRDLLVNNLTSLFLHEIRNPLHNLAAVLEDNKDRLAPEVNEIVERNLKRFEQVTDQYKRWDSLFENINPREPVDLLPWLEHFIEDKVYAQLRQMNVNFSQEIDPLTIHMHPILLEQSFVTLFSNAFKELERVEGQRKLILTAKLHPPSYKQIEIKLINSSKGFPNEVLEKQGRSPVESQSGLGLGLTLLRRVVEQVGGELVLSNFIDHAEVMMLIPERQS